MLLQCLLCLLIVIALGVLAWFCRTRLHLPIRTSGNMALTVHVTASGDAPGLEHLLRNLLWLCENGLIEGEILLEDCGLSPQTAAMAALLREQHHHIYYTREGEPLHGRTPGVDRAQREHFGDSLSK